MDQAKVVMEVGEFADWAVEQFHVSYDNVMFWDLMRSLDSNQRMPEGFEVDTSSDDIPAELYDLLMARKAVRVTQPAQQPLPTRASEWEQRDGTAE